MEVVQRNQPATRQLTDYPTWEWYHTGGSVLGFAADRLPLSVAVTRLALVSESPSRSLCITFIAAMTMATPIGR